MNPIRDIPKGALVGQSARLLARLAWRTPGAIRRFRRARREACRRTAPGERPVILLYYSQVVWQDVWQRPQEMALGLADYLPVIFASPLQVHRRYDSIRDWRAELRLDRGRGLRVLQPLILPGEYKSRAIFALNQRLVWAELCRALPPEADIVFLSNSPFSAPLLDRLDWRRKIYDIIDDFPGFSWAPPQSRRLEARWLAAADVVLTGTHALGEQHRAVRPDALFVPSGVRFEHFNRPREAAPEDLRALPRPLLGYVGTVSDRLDRALLEALCRAFPHGSVVLIGPVHGSFDAPRDCPNLRLLGPRPHDALPGYVQQFDLALMPFRDCPATRAINPIKTLEYLAAGRIVVSTALPDVVRFYAGAVVIARDRDEFIDLARRSLAADPEPLRARGIARAREASWEAAVRRVAQSLQLTPPAEGQPACVSLSTPVI